ncbi:MAG: tetratricopeptide repeat protein [Elusimicrobia bacterium]|nr:tetratricopeptide repeat protein [Elusimicrobiota bacterium]
MPTVLPPRAAPGAPPLRLDESLRHAGRLMRRFDVEGYAGAAARYRVILKAEPRSAPALAGLSETYAYWGFRREAAGLECRSYYDLARASAASALRYGPERADGHRAMSLAIGRGAEPDRERAKREAFLAVAIDPKDGEAWHQAWRAAGYDLADDSLRRAMELGRSFALENDLGTALCGAGRLDEAVARFMAALRLNPRNPLAYYNLAMTLDLKGMRRTAAEVVRKARGLHPDDALLQRGWDILGGGASACLEAA